MSAVTLPRLPERAIPATTLTGCGSRALPGGGFVQEQGEIGDNPRIAITLKSPEDLEHMRVAGRLAAEVLQVVAPYVKPGVTTAELDRVCHDHIVNVQHAIPANVGYGGGHGRIPFPFTVCTSVNNVICHGMPSEGKVLKDGDTVNIDVTVIKDGWHGDTSRMYYVGTPSVMAKRLVETTREAMFRGIRMVKPGATLREALRLRHGLW